VDGAHIKGLIMNMLETYWPELLKIEGFVQTVNTPIVKVWKGTARERKEQIIFYTQSAYHKWVEKHTNMTGKNNIKKWTIKYYKGLGTSDDREAKADFKDFSERILSFVDIDKYPTSGKSGESGESGESSDSDDSSDSGDSGDSGDSSGSHTKSNKEADKSQFALTKETTNHFNLAFNGKFANQRKIWLSNYDKDSILEPNETMTITYPDFVNKDLKHFSNYDNLRSIPSIMDGFKPSHRKIMCYMFKRGYNKPEAKVAQLSGYVSAETAYHHGEASLQGTIIGMAQNFVGSNNINFLCPNGNFGFRKENGKDSASARYIFTNLETITEKIFRPEDQYILTPQFEEGCEIEPVYYAPIIPTILVNGGTGIGTGYSTTIPPFNPKDIINNIINMIKQKNVNVMTPWFRGFKGVVVKHPVSPVKYMSKGVYVIDNNKVTVTEIPVDKSTSQYCAYLHSKLPDGKDKDNTNSIIESVKNDSLNHKINFTVTFKNDELKTLLRSGGDAKLRDFLKLDAPISLTNLHLYDADGVIKKYDSPEDILEEFFVERRKIYQKRIDYMIAKLKNNFELIKFKIKYIKYIIDETIKIKKVTTESVLARLEELKFPKLHNDHLAPEEDRSYSYLTSMSLLSLTSDKIDELEKELEKRHVEYDDYKTTSIEDRWIRELKELEKAYDKWLPESIASITDCDEDTAKTTKKKMKVGINKNNKK
jgi:DNA topoisomerase-2